MKGPKSLQKREDNWKTNMGAWFPGEGAVIRGKDLLHDFKNNSWMSLFLYGITGRKFTKNQIKLFEALWMLSTSYPDPRLWNNRVASLAGTVRSTRTLGISAAISISEATIYGQRPIIKAFDFLIHSKSSVEQGNKLIDIIKYELKKYRSIPGFGRPIIKYDERIIPVYELAEKLGCVNGPYVKLAFDIETILVTGRWRMQMNIAALAAALAADQGLTCDEYYSYVIPCFLAGLMPCIIDSNNKFEGSFLPLSCERVNYNGKSRRIWVL